MSDQPNKPQSLAPDQLQWMEEQGLTFHAALMPDRTHIATPDKSPGVDGSRVQLAISIESRGKQQIIVSDFVRNTKGEINRLMKAQFELARKALLTKHFEIVELKPIDPTEAE